MTYRCASIGLAAYGLPDNDQPGITCDGCRMETIKINAPPPKWFLDGKPKRGWSIEKTDETRMDFCPSCTAERRAKR